MKTVRNYKLAVSLLLLVALSQSISAQQVNLFIKNDTGWTFQTKFKQNGQEVGPIRIGARELRLLGPTNEISELRISQPGSPIDKNYYPQENELRQCQAFGADNCAIIIETRKFGATWGTKVSEDLGPALTQHPATPAEYFPDVNEPRYVLGLTKNYSASQIASYAERTRNQITITIPDSIKRRRMLKFIDTAQAYAQAFATPPPKPEQQQSLRLKWAGQLQPLRVEQGATLACNIMTGNIRPPKNTQEYLNGIVNLMWYFYSLAIDKNQPFNEGTFVIKDDGLKFYRFLLQYAKEVNHSITGSLSDPAHKLANNPQAYSRASSHYKNDQIRFRQYGIDIRFTPKGPIELILPANKGHLLFGQIEGNKTFIKLENAGLGTREVPQHAKEFLAAQIRKYVPKMEGSLVTSLGPQFFDNLIYYIGSDDDPIYYRKERVPLEFILKCTEILKSNTETPVALILPGFISQGMQELNNFVQNPWENAVNSKQLTDLKAYLAKLNREYDHVEMRSGREIILTPEEIARTCR